MEASIELARSLFVMHRRHDQASHPYIHTHAHGRQTRTHAHTYLRHGLELPCGLAHAPRQVHNLVGALFRNVR
jgi:hypothetical protein